MEEGGEQKEIQVALVVRRLAEPTSGFQPDYSEVANGESKSLETG